MLWWMKQFENFKKSNEQHSPFIPLNDQDKEFYKNLEFYLLHNEFMKNTTRKRYIRIFYNLIEYFYNEYKNSKTFYEKRKIQRLVQGLNNHKINNVFWLYGANSFVFVKNFTRYGIYNLVKDILYDAKQLLDDETWEFITMKKNDECGIIILYT